MSVQNFQTSCGNDDNLICLRKEVASFIRLIGLDATNENLIREYLEGSGYEQVLVDDTCEWLNLVFLSGRSSEVLDMIQQQDIDGLRVENPSDQQYLSDKIWRKISSWQMRGILPSDVVERLLIGLRNIDVRGWEEEEVSELVANLIYPGLDSYSKIDFRFYEETVTGGFYC